MNDSEANLKSVLARTMTRSDVILKPAERFTEAVENIRGLWQEVTMPHMGRLALDELAWKVHRCWEDTRSIECLTSRERRRIPMVLFHSIESKSRAAIGRDASFLSYYLDWLGERVGHNGRQVIGVLHQYLMNYAPEDPSCEQLRKGLLTLMEGNIPGMVSSWRERCERCGWLREHADREFARIVMTSAESVEEVLRACGFDGALGASGFLRHSILQCYKMLPEDLVKENCIEKWRRARALTFVGKNARLDGIVPAFANASLIMWEPAGRFQPGEELRDLIRDSLIEALGDPRGDSRKRWRLVKPEARDVIMSWLVAKSLSDFFSIIDSTANPAQWKYRERFWRSYLEKGAIDEAWVIYGKSAAERAKQAGVTDGSYGILRSGADRNHSALLMKVGNMIIAEGSHNWACRFWHDTAGSAPVLYRPEYAREDLMDRPLATIAHNGAVTRTWQGKVASFLEMETGIRVRDWDYM